jgi:hypothetical protein
MKEITLNIPENKLRFFMELFKQLGLEIKNNESYLIPDEHKEIVLNRIKNTKETDLLNWEDIKDNFNGIES